MRAGVGILKDVNAHAGRRLWVLFVLLFLTGISDGISMALLYPLLELIGIGNPEQAGSSTLGKAFQYVFHHLGIEPTLPIVAFVFVSAFLIQHLFYTAQNWMLANVQKNYIAFWQRRLFAEFVASEWSYFVSRKAGELTNLVIVECVRLGAAFFAILQLIVAALIACVYIGISVAASWNATLYMVGAALILILVLYPIRQATRRYGAVMSTLNASMSMTVNEMISGAKFIKTSAGQDKAKELMGVQIDEMRSTMIWSAFLPTTVRSFFEFGAVLMVLAIVLFGTKSQGVSTLNLLLIMALIGRLMPRLMQIQSFQNSLNLNAPAFGMLQDAYAQFVAHREPISSGNSLPSGLCDLVATDVVVRYGDNVVLDDVSFTVAAGQTIGFVGASGAGKTTLVDVVVGLLRPARGNILFGSVDLKDFDLSAWRGRLSYVSQETFLFHDTIANNIRWNMPDVSTEAIRAVAEAVGLDQFIMRLPSGYDTVVGDRGAKLSGGQRQRISLARALLREPSLLILDEATSALDSLSEQDVMSVINSLRGKMSILIVAHRFTAVRNADYIYVLDRGRIVEQGTWERLSGGQAQFRKLMDAQMIDGPIDVEAR